MSNKKNKNKISTTICSISARNTYNKQHLMTILQTWGREAYEDHTPLGREAYEWGRPTVTILLLQGGGEGGGWAHTYCTGLQTNNHALARPASLTYQNPWSIPRGLAIKPIHKGIKGATFHHSNPNFVPFDENIWDLTNSAWFLIIWLLGILLQTVKKFGKILCSWILSRKGDFI